MLICSNTGEQCASSEYCARVQSTIDSPDLHPIELINGQAISELPLAVAAALSGEGCVDRRLDALSHLVVNNRANDPRTARIAEGIAEMIGYQRTQITT